jgi:uncharacterized Zn finger protein
MDNCLNKNCNKELVSLIKSKEKEDGSFYIICTECGYVMEVTKDAAGNTTIHPTPNDNSAKTKAQMIEAKSLFEEANYNVYKYSYAMNGTQYDIDKLNDEKVLVEEKIEPTGKIAALINAIKNIFSRFK